MALPPITTTTTIPCQDTYKSVALVAGEQFILPPGATIVGGTNINAITSTCEIPTDLEELECFATTFAESNPGGSETPVYDDVVINGIRVDNIEYPFAFPISVYTTNPIIIDALNTTPYGAVIFSIANSFANSPSRGQVNYIVLTTFPAIAKDFYFYGNGTGKVNSPTSSSIPISFKLIPYDERDTSGELSWPSCPLTQV
jgi:hypothetical protein